MTRRIAAISFIFICTTIAWMILGSTILGRTYSLPDQLKSKVASTWGVAQEQSPATATYFQETVRAIEDTSNGGHKTRQIKFTEPVLLPVEGSAVKVVLDLEHRQKGLLWYSTYSVSFDGMYTF